MTLLFIFTFVVTATTQQCSAMQTMEKLFITVELKIKKNLSKLGKNILVYILETINNCSGFETSARQPEHISCRPPGHNITTCYYN